MVAVLPWHPFCGKAGEVWFFGVCSRTTRIGENLGVGSEFKFTVEHSSRTTQLSQCLVARQYAHVFAVKGGCNTHLTQIWEILIRDLPAYPCYITSARCGEVMILWTYKWVLCLYLLLGRTFILESFKLLWRVADLGDLESWRTLQLISFF
jgi:hypothetical protein